LAGRNHLSSFYLSIALTSGLSSDTRTNQRTTISNAQRNADQNYRNITVYAAAGAWKRHGEQSSGKHFSEPFKQAMQPTAGPRDEKAEGWIMKYERKAELGSVSGS
jgi:hypothetical protein